MQSFAQISTQLPWEEIDTVLLDMDGTLLDRHYDDYFWEVHLPEHYSLLHDLPVDKAAEELLARYRTTENSLQWADIDHWSRELKLDIPELKLRIGDLIAVHPHVLEFLAFCREQGKQLFLVTNAHPRTLAIKLERTKISGWFDRLICAEEVGFAKEEPQFWGRLQEMLGFDPARSLLADDTEKVLRTAEHCGIGFLLHIAKPNSRRQPSRSSRYASVETFAEFMAAAGQRRREGKKHT